MLFETTGEMVMKSTRIPSYTNELVHKRAPDGQGSRATHRDLVVNLDLRLASSNEATLGSDIDQNLVARIEGLLVCDLERECEVGLAVGMEGDVILLTSSNSSVVDGVENLHKLS